jgi:hypothetical protein
MICLIPQKVGKKEIEGLKSKVSNLESHGLDSTKLIQKKAAGEGQPRVTKSDQGVP